MPSRRPYPCVCRARIATAVVACAALAAAQPLPDLDLDPAPSADLLRLDLAEPVHAATVWLLEVDDDAFVVWIWRVPGDPDPIDLFADNAWADPPNVVVRDLGEAMGITVEVYGEYFEAVDPGWSDRALALAERLAGIEQRVEMYTVIADDGASSYIVQVSDGLVEVATLDLIEGTWVQVTRIRA